jgi:GDP-D-mannose dehydratase
MEAAWKMMQNPEPDDFTLGTGLSLSLKELVDKCSFKLNISPEVTQIADSSVRKTDFDSIRINALEAQLFLNWTPRRAGEETLLSIIEHKLTAFDN